MNMINSEKNLSRLGLLIGICLLVYLLWLMIFPHLPSFIFAGIIAGPFYSLYQRVLHWRGMNQQRAAIIICLLVFFICFLPVVYIVFHLTREVMGLYVSIFSGEGVIETVKSYFLSDHFLVVKLKSSLAFFGLKLDRKLIEVFFSEHLRQSSLMIVNYLNNIAKNIFSFLFDFVIMMLMLFTLLCEGKRIKSFVANFFYLPIDQENLVISKFNQMNFVVLICNGVSALVQALLATLCLGTFGVESLFFWFTIMFLLAFIPVVGISFVYVPFTAYFFFQDRPAAAIILFLFCTAVSFAVENWFRPKFIGERIMMSSWVIFWSMVGGVAAFGMAGIFYGPLVASLFLTFSDIYHLNYITRVKSA